MENTRGTNFDRQNEEHFVSVFASIRYESEIVDRICCWLTTLVSVSVLVSSVCYHSLSDGIHSTSKHFNSIRRFSCVTQNQKKKKTKNSRVFYLCVEEVVIELVLSLLLPFFHIIRNRKWYKRRKMKLEKYQHQHMSVHFHIRWINESMINEMSWYFYLSCIYNFRILSSVPLILQLNQMANDDTSSPVRLRKALFSSSSSVSACILLSKLGPTSFFRTNSTKHLPSFWCYLLVFAISGKSIFIGSIRIRNIYTCELFDFMCKVVMVVCVCHQ